MYTIIWYAPLEKSLILRTRKFPLYQLWALLPKPTFCCNEKISALKQHNTHKERYNLGWPQLMKRKSPLDWQKILNSQRLLKGHYKCFPNADKWNKPFRSKRKLVPLCIYCNLLNNKCIPWNHHSNSFSLQFFVLFKIF